MRCFLLTSEVACLKCAVFAAIFVFVGTEAVSLQ